MQNISWYVHFIYFQSSFSPHLVMFDFGEYPAPNGKKQKWDSLLSVVLLFNLRPSKANIHEQTGPSLFQILTFCLSGDKSYLRQRRLIAGWALRNERQCDLNQNINFIHENKFERLVYKMAVILFWPRCVNMLLHASNTSLTRWKYARSRGQVIRLTVRKAGWWTGTADSKGRRF